ncbi:hypothetical protein GR724_15325 [Listeria monocytogenes]|nr:hypothetical protein [Listeria monocytogenes]EFN3147717.1 hypothetical protein [Listeria monocytogenes]HAG7163976.1 hypothetical protein [Listeria monocytogenes]HAK3661083.1 hypothetical protein [Listeria monocytogenes]
MANVQKFTSANMKGLSIHLDRKTENHSNKEIDPERTHLNYDLCKKDGDTLSRMAQRLENVYCMKRDDVKVGCSWVVTLPASLKEKNENDQQAFFEKTYEFLSDRYGGEKNVLSANVHNDETTPHLHFTFMPVVWDEKKEREKVSAKEVLTRNELKQFHGDLDNFLKKEIPEIYREGILNGETIGLESVRDIKKYSKEIQEKKDELTKDLKMFKEPKIILDKIEKSAKKSMFGDKITLTSSDFDRLKELSVSGIKLKNNFDKLKKLSKTEIKDLKESVQHADQRAEKFENKVNEYEVLLEKTLSAGKKFRENQIIYKSMLKDTNRDLEISPLEKRGRIIIDKIENNKIPEDSDTLKKWVLVLEENKQSETIPLNRIDSAINTLREFLQQIVDKVKTFSIDGLKSRNKEIQRDYKPDKNQSRGPSL